MAAPALFLVTNDEAPPMVKVPLSVMAPVEVNDPVLVVSTRARSIAAFSVTAIAPAAATVPAVFKARSVKDPNVELGSSKVIEEPESFLVINEALAKLRVPLSVIAPIAVNDTDQSVRTDGISRAPA